MQSILVSRQGQAKEKFLRGWNLLTLPYSIYPIYPYEVKRMGKATGNRIQIGVANVENGATTYACRTITDRDSYSASAGIGI